MSANTRLYVKKLTLSAMFLALGLMLPLLTGQLHSLGNMLLPMHLPVLLCGLICGWQYGGLVGFILPLLRFSIFGMPRMPLAIPMAFELAAYGLIVGILFALSKNKSIWAVYRSLLIAMAGGRVVWAAGRIILAGVSEVPFGWQVFFTAGFVEAVPGIILQLILIPAIMAALTRAGLVPLTARDAVSHKA